MTTVIRGPRPEVEAFLEQRRRLGQDRFDEVWDGVYVVAPDPTSDHGEVQGSLWSLIQQHAQQQGLRAVTTFNLGVEGDFRVPDAGLLPRSERGAWISTALLVVEVLSADDATFDKLGFYAAKGVRELLVADPDAHTVRVLDLQAGGVDQEASTVLGLTRAEIEAAVDWPTD
ncbi:MAG: hypothetical protein JWO60_2835 [Frankiales bacterium]|nr:hypothetical protein [Frankiales bacterium]